MSGTVSWVGRVRPPPCPPPNQPSLDAESVQSIMMIAYGMIALAVAAGGMYALSSNPHARIWLRVQLFKLGYGSAIHQATAVPQADDSYADDDREAGLVRSASSRGGRAQRGGGMAATKSKHSASARAPPGGHSFQGACAKSKPGRAVKGGSGGDGSGSATKGSSRRK